MIGPLSDQCTLNASVSPRGSVHVAPYLKDLSAETGPFLRYEANLHQCTPIAGKAQKLDACTRECLPSRSLRTISTCTHVPWCPIYTARCLIRSTCPCSLIIIYSSLQFIMG